jgi:hypothetical protein
MHSRPPSDNRSGHRSASTGKNHTRTSSNASRALPGFKSLRPLPTDDELQVVVNVYYYDKEENKATLVGKHISVEGMLQISKLFEQQGPTLPRHPHERNTICWDLPATHVSLAGATAYFSWVASLNLPLPEKFAGRKTMNLDPEWGILQFRSLYQVMSYIDLKPRFGHVNVRDKICDWLREGKLTTDHLVKLWNQVSVRDGLRVLIVAQAVEYGYDNATLAELEKALEEDGAMEDFMEAYKVRRCDKEAWAERQRYAMEGPKKSKDDKWESKGYVVIR